MLSYNTIQELIDGGYTLTAHCPCHHRQKLDLEKLKAKLGPDHSTLHVDLAHKLRCSKCGSKNVGLILSPPGPKGDIGMSSN